MPRTDQFVMVDAHRHGLYDLRPDFTLAGVPVERWSEDLRFVAHEKWTKGLCGPALVQALGPWLQVSFEEGVRQVVDWSGKHVRGEVAAIYDRWQIEHFGAAHWSSWTPESDLTVKALILPDERGLDESAARRARDFLARSPNGFVTLHVLESASAADLARERWGCTTVDWLDKHCLLTPRTLLVHLNAATPSDLACLQDHGVHVVLCPAARFALNNPEPPFQSGLYLHFGTDAALVTGERRLREQAAMQFRSWRQIGVSEQEAVREAVLALFRPLPTNQDEAWSEPTVIEEFSRGLSEFASEWTL